MVGSAGRNRVGYKEIAEELRRRIDSGELPPGGKVPGENELTTTYGVEQPTARRALEMLKNEGLIAAKRGSGTYVREFRLIRRTSPDRLREVVWGGGRSIWSADLGVRPHAGTTTITVEDPPRRIAHVLELNEGTPVVVRRRQFFVDDRPLQLATSYYPQPLVAGSAILDQNTGDGGAYARLAELGHKPVRFREELQTRMPREAERHALALAQGTPVILIVRTAYTADDQPVEVNEMTLDASSYLLEYKFSSE